MGKSTSKSAFANYKQNFQIYDKDPHRGLIYLISKRTKQQYLLKQIIKKDLQELKILERQLQNKKKIRHQHLASLQQYYIDYQNNNATILYKFPFRNLEQQRNQRIQQNIPFQQNQLWSILASLILGFSFLQRNGILHSQVRSSNIYVQQNGVIKISDPFAKQLNTNYEIAQKMNFEFEPQIYLSPCEIDSLCTKMRIPRHNGFKSDVFSLGIVILQLALLKIQDTIYKNPKGRINKNEIDRSIQECGRKYSQQLISIIKIMLQMEQKNRLDWNQLESFVKKDQQLLLNAQVKKQNQYQQEKMKTSLDFIVQNINIKNNEHKNNLHLIRHEFNNKPVQNKYLIQPNFNKKQINNTTHTRPSALNKNSLILNSPLNITQQQYKPQNVNHIFHPNSPVQIHQKNNNFIPPIKLNYINSPLNKVIQKQQFKNISLNLQSFPKYLNTTRYEKPVSYQKQIINKPISYNQKNMSVKKSIIIPHDKMDIQKLSLQKISNSIYLQLNPTKISEFSQHRNQNITKGFQYKNPVFLNKSMDSNKMKQVQIQKKSSHFKNQKKKQLISQFKKVKEINQQQKQSEKWNNINKSIIQEIIQIKKIDNIKEYQQSSSVKEEKSSVSNTKNKENYQGQYYKSIRHGKGKYYFEDGGIYQGQWVFNRMQGYGKLYYASGSLAYQGNWLQDHFHGKGKLFNENYKILKNVLNYTNLTNIDDIWEYYEGNFEFDVKNGKGILKFSNGQKFEGNFHQDFFHGQGIFYGKEKIIKGVWNFGKLFKQY